MGNRFGSPMLLIGLYIAFASLICIFAMGADLVDGFRSKELWFPCKYFRINSFYLTVISVAMKLPVDLTGLMLGRVDQVAKMGSMAFMCTIMANLLPYIGTMVDNDLYSNMAALGVLVITMVVNVCIQMKTGVVSASTYNNKDPRIAALVSTEHNVVSLPKTYTLLPIIYLTLLLVLLVIYVCSCFGVLGIKEFMKVPANKVGADGQILTVKELEEYVTNHWIMARTSNSQFIFTALFPTTCACGVICVSVAILHILTIIWSFEAMLAKDYDSDYGWSTMAIVSLQLIGVVIGTIAPLCRCFAPNISFVSYPRDCEYYRSVCEHDEFLTFALYDWRAVSTGLPSSMYIEVVIQTLKRVIVNFCIGFQVVVLVVCQVTALGPYYIWFSVKWLLNAVFSSHDGERTVSLDYDLSGRLSDKLRISTRTLEGLLESVKQLIQKGENKKPHIDLLEKSTSDFYGLRLYGELAEDQNYWSLQVINLATIACSLPEIEKKQVDWLLTNVRGCLPYIILVDKTFNDTFRQLQKNVEVLWEEVYAYHQWLGNKLPFPGDPSFQLSTARQVVEWFKDTAEQFADFSLFEDSITIKRGSVLNINVVKSREYLSRFLLMGAMHSTCSEISSSHRWDGDDILASQWKLFDSLSLFIADIIAACLTNLPQVILQKCHPKELVEEMEANAKDTALLLGETKQIIKLLGERDIPNINPSDMPFYDKWHAFIMSRLP